MYGDKQFQFTCSGGDCFSLRCIPWMFWLLAGCIVAMFFMFLLFLITCCCVCARSKRIRKKVVYPAQQTSVPAAYPSPVPFHPAPVIETRVVTSRRPMPPPPSPPPAPAPYPMAPTSNNSAVQYPAPPAPAPYPIAPPPMQHMGGSSPYMDLADAATARSERHSSRHTSDIVLPMPIIITSVREKSHKKSKHRSSSKRSSRRSSSKRSSRRSSSSHHSRSRTSRSRSRSSHSRGRSSSSRSRSTSDSRSGSISGRSSRSRSGSHRGSRKHHTERKIFEVSSRTSKRGERPSLKIKELSRRRHGSSRSD